MENDMYSQLLVELECPVCTNYMMPPIRQCKSGHSICEVCRKRLPKCPLCQEKFLDSRNISLEGLAAKMHYPCVNKDSGCTAVLSLSEREQHEASCMYKGFKCGMDRCTWVGKYEEIETHWGEKKTSSKPYGFNNVCHSKLKPDLVYVNLVKAHNKLFWFKCKVVQGKIFWAVQYIGSNNEADNYHYQVEIFKPGLTRRKVTFTDYCHKLGDEEIFVEGNCLSMSLEALKQFIGEDQVLIYYLRVYEEKNKQEDGAEGVNLKEQRQQKQNLPHHNQNIPPTGVLKTGTPNQRKQHRPWVDKKKSGHQKQKN